MKKLITLSLLALVLTVANAQTPPAVLKAFNSSFHDAQQVEWFSSSDNYVVHFQHEGVSMVITYDKYGTLQGSKRISEKETLLPLSVLHELKQRYSDKRVTLVTERFEEGIITYNIQLQNDKQIWIVSATTNGSFAVLEKMNKQG